MIRRCQLALHALQFTCRPPNPNPPSPRELHDKYVRLGERMEALVKEGKVLKSSASAEAGAARTAVQVRHVLNRVCGSGAYMLLSKLGQLLCILSASTSTRATCCMLRLIASEHVPALPQDALRDADAAVKERAALVARVRELQVQYYITPGWSAGSGWFVHALLCSAGAAVLEVSKCCAAACWLMRRQPRSTTYFTCEPTDHLH